MKNSVFYFLISLVFICHTSIIRGGVFVNDEEINTKIEYYVNQNIDTYTLSRDLRMQLHRNLMVEYEQIDCGAYPQEVYEERINTIKTFFLKRDYFKKYPNSKEKYTGDFSVPNYFNLTTCDVNGGFEASLSAIQSTYEFMTLRQDTTYAEYPYGGSTIDLNNNPLDIDPTNNPLEFETYPGPNANLPINSEDEPVSIMSGFNSDNPITETPEIYSGTKAIRLNPIDDFFANTLDITAMTRTFINDRDKFGYFFNLILHNPKTGSGHNFPETEQAFFRVRIYHEGEIVRERVFISQGEDCYLLYDEERGIVYTDGWAYDELKIPGEYMNEVLKAEFVAGDCVGSKHAGTVYIDDICPNIPVNPIYGDIYLDPINESCPTEDFIEVCGTFNLPPDTLPADSGNITLIITDDNDDSYEIILNLEDNIQNHNGSLSQNGYEGTFCFDIPINLLILNGTGSSPYGEFYFQAEAQFFRDCQNLYEMPPITSNRSGPVDFTGCIIAENDEFSLSNCESLTFSVLANDLLFGQTPEYSDVNISLGILSTIIPPGISFNTETGTVTVMPGTEPGNYAITYKICNKYAPEDCDTASINIHISEPEIEAVNDDFTESPIDACEGGDTPSVRLNDLYCDLEIGSMPTTPSGPGFYFDLVSDDGTDAEIDVNGKISIPPNTPSGEYILKYKICLDEEMENCSEADVLIKVVKTTPTFNFPTTICKGSELPQLPETSLEGYTGTWSPSEVDNEEDGTYTFTPTDSDCIETTNIQVNIDENCPLFLGWEGEVGCQEGMEPRKRDFDSDIVDGNCIRFCEDSNATFSIFGSVSGIESIDWEIIGGTIQNEQDHNIEVEWDEPGFGYIEVTLHLSNGETKDLHICVEIVPKPTADFEIHGQNEPFEGCAETALYFENLSNTNGGHDELYYYWDFGDGHTSSEFEPSHTYANPGTYEVSLQVSNGCSCVDEVTQKVNIDRPFPEIECVSVECEGVLAHYELPLDPQNYEPEKCPVMWSVEGGQIVYESPDHLSVSVSWDHVDEDGFGYLTAGLKCGDCATTAKVPVVTMRGFIQGEEKICTDEQATFSLPQWPSTEFDWSIESNTNATIIQNIQRNEIIVQAAEPGTITLNVSYFNTLLGCGGQAQRTIKVQPEINLKQPETVCKDNSEEFLFVDHQGNPITTPVDYLILGPNEYSQSGNGTNFNQSFPESGLYKVFIDSDDYCIKEVLTITVAAANEEPTNIEGKIIVCPGVSYSYSTEVPEGFSAHWTVENGTILGSSMGDQISVEFEPGAQDGYEVAVYFDNGNCSSETLVLEIEADTMELEITSEFDEVCGSSYATYFVTDDSAETYEWSIDPENAGSVAAGQNTNEVDILWNAEHQPATVKIKVRKCGIDYQDSFAVDITGPPEVEFDLANTDQEVCVGETASFALHFLEGEGNYSEVIWDFGDGSSVESGNINRSHTFEMPLSESTTYTVTATVINPDGCGESVLATFDIVVAPSPVVEISPNYIDLCDETESNEMGINVQTGFGSTTEVIWFHNGSQLNENGNFTIDAENYGTGNYYATVGNSFGCIETTSIVTVEDSCPGSTNPGNCPSLSVSATAEVTDCQEVTLEFTNQSGPPGTLFYYVGLESLGGNINDTGNEIIISNLEPGYYSLTAKAVYQTEEATCVDYYPLSFIIPYKAGLKYEVACQANDDLYEVNILDHSVYYPDANISGYNYEFKVDNGNWQPGVLQDDIYQHQAMLEPGSHTLWVRIQDNNAEFPACATSTTLELPDIPNADFGFENHGCANQAIFFSYEGESVNGLHYEWAFEDGSTNTQQSPAKTFSAGTHDVTLKVTNEFGCSVSQIHSLTVTEPELEGELKADQDMACEGETITLYFEPGSEQEIPETIEWYRNTEIASKEFLGTGETLEVEEGGQYYVFIKTLNGCYKYDTEPKSINFISLPKAPKIKGEDLYCLGDEVKLSVPEIEGLHYNWFLIATNGSAPQLIATDENEITNLPTSEGTYQYVVIPTYGDGDPVSCIGEPAFKQVTVWKLPETPEIGMEVLSCQPYEVKLKVLNPEPEVSYSWSNGDSGLETTMTHDGPIEVSAHIGNCRTSNQIDLPIELEALAWIFPEGCYSTCYKDYIGYIIGPFGEFEEWTWLQDSQPYQSGTGSVEDLSVSKNHDYGLYLATEDCELELGNLEITGDRCPECRLDVQLKAVDCLVGQEGYAVKLSILNGTGYPLGANLVVPGGEGFFMNSGLTLDPGMNDNLILYFMPSDNFIAGEEIEIFIEGYIEDKQCMHDFSIRFPPCQTGHSFEPDKEKSFSLSLNPNPTHNYQTKALYNTASKEGNYQLVIRDLYGRSLQKKKLPSGQGEIPLDCSGLANGTYMVCLQRGGQILKTAKLIIK